MPRALHSCAVYISSGVSSIATRAAARAIAAPQVAVVDTFTDPAYARSSVKLVAEGAHLVAAARAVVEEAMSLVDLSQEPHPAPHPRCGAVDMVSFMPLSELSDSATAEGLRECDSLAWELASSIAELECPVLLYGPRAGRSLLEARRATTFFSSVKADACREVSLTLPPDVGPSTISQRRGVCVIGAQPYVTNFNIQVEHASLDDCRLAAKALRSHLAIQVRTGCRVSRAVGSHIGSHRGARRPSVSN